jgi:hypothetical protein
MALTNGEDQPPAQVPSDSVRLRIDVELTPLPEIDRALSLLRLLGPLVTGAHARYRIAVLRALQEDGAGRWPIARIHALVNWMERSSVTTIVAELRAHDLLVRDEIDQRYRIPPNVRALVALLDALSVPDVPPRAMVRLIGQAMTVARTTGAGDARVLGQFRSAMAQLRAGGAELGRLIDDHSDEALYEAGLVLRDNAEDMGALLREHADFLAAHPRDGRLLDLEQEALELVARVGGLAGDVVAFLSDRAEARLRMSGRIDRSELREVIAGLGEAGLAGVVDGLVQPGPGVATLDGAAALEALATLSGRTVADPPPLPAATSPVRAAPPPTVEPAVSMRDELLALAEPALISDVVARVGWRTAVARQLDVLEAYARFAEVLPALALRDKVHPVRTAGVERMTASTIEGLAA